MWWRCAQYFLLPLVAIYIETIDVCILRMFVFMSGVVTLHCSRYVCWYVRKEGILQCLYNY